jgi:Uma2 family endonuclease
MMLRFKRLRQLFTFPLDKTRTNADNCLAPSPLLQTRVLSHLPQILAPAIMALTHVIYKAARRDKGDIMTAQPKPVYSVETYLEMERTGSLKHEYYRGEIFALAGSSEAHNLILTNILTSLNVQLRKRPCKVYPSDMRLKIPKTGLYTYPDVSIVCGAPQFDDSKRDTLLNPIVVIEILSPSTERYDRGKKFQSYRTVSTLQEYVLVSQDDHHIEHYVNQNDGNWLLTSYDGINTALQLKAIDCTLSLDDVYNKVDIEISPEDLPPNAET